jgi:tRNA (guanine-N1)-methyltransferase
MVHFHIVTLFPESIEPYLNSSIIGRAQKAKKIKISYYDPKKFTRDRYGRVDRRPYGGGPGMVLEPDGMLRAIEKAKGKKRAETIFFSTDGAQFDDAMALRLSKKKPFLFLLGLRRLLSNGDDENIRLFVRAWNASLFLIIMLRAATLFDADAFVYSFVG